MKKCKDNANYAQFIPVEIKNNINQTATGKGLYAQVIMLRQKDLKFVAADKNKNEAKFSSMVNTQDPRVGLILTFIVMR